MTTSLAVVCPGCFQHKEEAVAICPQCGYDTAALRSPLLLPVLICLNQRYLVGRPLGKPGGFGVTYLGFDLTLQVKVAIKEYCPRDLVGRDAGRQTLMAHSHEDGDLFRFGLQAFLDEARTLAKFDHANVVRVRDFFEANSTAYLVMDYYEGESLLEYLERQGGRLPWRNALTLMLPILDGLREVHRRNFLHRDIKPHNIYLTAQGRPILLDFGSARQAMGQRSRSLSVVLTEGYAPFEQYHSRGAQGPWTDIYGAAATLYLLLTGQTPLSAPERIQGDELIPPLQLVPDLPEPLNTALLNGLAMDVKQRPQTMDQFEQSLHGVLEETKQTPKTAPVDFEKQREHATPEEVKEQTHDVKNSEKNPGSWKFFTFFIFIALAFLVTIFIEPDNKKNSNTSEIETKPLNRQSQGAPQDDTDEVSRLRMAAEQGDAYAQYNLGVMYANGRGVPQNDTEAVRWYRMAAEQGDADAQYNLGVRYANGKGVPQNDTEAVRWYRMAAAQGHVVAQAALGEMYANGEGVPQNDTEAVRWFRMAAAQGDADAQFKLGWMYATGRGVPQNDTEAVRWYRMAAEKGDAYAQTNLGSMYATGKGVPQNDTEAVRWYRMAAEQGHAGAQSALGAMYATGKGVPQNDTEAVRWWRMAAEQGNALAQGALGVMYAEGRGVPKNDTEAVRWFRMAAEQGNAGAQNNLGAMYAEGKGVPKNDTEAVRWYRMAAAQGHAYAQANLGAMYAEGRGVPQNDQNDTDEVSQLRMAAAQGNAAAQTNLGWMYYTGKGVPQNDTEAIRWCRKAADQNYADAQFKLGVMYANGRGVPKNDTEAVRWWRMAAEQNHDKAKKILQKLGYE